MKKIDEKDRRKYYRMSIPVFTKGETIPTSNYDYFVKTPIECYKKATELLEDDEFRLNTGNWVSTWITYKREEL